MGWDGVGWPPLGLFSCFELFAGRLGEVGGGGLSQCRCNCISPREARALYLKDTVLLHKQPLGHGLVVLLLQQQLLRIGLELCCCFKARFTTAWLLLLLLLWP